MNYRTPLTIVAGAAAGLIGSILSPHSSNGKAREPSHESATLAPPSPFVPTPVAEDMRLGELESEVRGLREKAAAGEPPRAEERGAVPRVSREEADRERHQKREDAIASHWQEPFAPAWASETAAVVDRELSGFAEAGHFSLEKVDCRSSTCVADIRFASYTEARAGWSQITPTDHGGHPFTVDIEIPPTDDVSSPYTATILYTAIKM
jgi:hypothetical protein